MLFKAGRITNLTDARYFAAREVDYLGFHLEEGSEAYLDPMFMHAIREWVEGPKVVGEFRSSSPEVIREAAAFLRLDAVQVPWNPQYSEALSGLDVLVELPAAIGPAALRERMAAWKGLKRLFVVDFSGHEHPPASDEWRQLCAGFPCLLHLDAAPEAWRRFAETLHPKGFSLFGGTEERVGVKSFDDLDEIFGVLGR